MEKDNKKTFLFIFLTTAALFAANVLFSLRGSYQGGAFCQSSSTAACTLFQELFDLGTWRTSLIVISILLFTLLILALSRRSVHQKRNNLRRLILTSLFVLILHTVSAWIAAGQEQGLFSILARMSYLALLALLVTSTALSLENQEAGILAAPNGKRTNRIVFGTLLVSTITLVSGAVSTMFPPTRACGLWPLCSERFLPAGPGEWLYLLHVIIVGSTVFFLARLLLHAWREHRNSPRVLVTATLAFTLFLGEIMIGAFQVSTAQPVALTLLHAQTSISVWAALFLLYAFLRGAMLKAGNADSHPAYQTTFAWKNFFQITKPLIVLLLLFTTFTGMVMAGKGMPDLPLTLVTLLAGALAAGGSGALNQYIDRHLDREMTRTAQRPIAAGRIFPAEGLAFGTGMLVISFYLMAKFVNLPAALLSVAGMLYYLLAYSLVLKQRTAWNIVIGGGAGAIPPLVGWAAVQGHLDLFAWGLFLIILLWTPTHFWSLALVREKEYTVTNIPMLPVVKGRKNTIQVILGSTVLLVMFTWLIAVWKPFNWLYPLTALLAGLVLIYFALRLWRRDDNRIAHALYRCSNIYLGVLFFALILESVIF